MKLKSKSKYLSSAFLLLLTSIIVKIIGAVYKIPLTSFIGAVGRGYFAAAYNLYLPLHAILMGSFPIALSRLVSKHNAEGNKAMLTSLKKGSLNVFFISGMIGTVIILLAAKPYSVLIAGSPKSVYTILVLAPSLLFSCLAACYRSYFEGFMNMKPTSVSQTIEALFKMIFGLAFAKFSMAYMYQSYLVSGAVFGTVLRSEEEALSYIYPFTSAAAMLGVSLGSLVSLVYAWVYYIINRDKTLPQAAGSEGRSELLSFSFPIMISCAVQSIFQFLDTASIQFALGRISTDNLKEAYGECITIAGVSDNDLVTYVYGLFSTALDFKNLIPGVTMALGVCAVPALCREYECGTREKLGVLMNSIYKYTSLLSVFGGVFIALCSRDMLSLFYASSSPDIVDGCDELVRLFAFSVPLYSLASTAVFCVQAVGKPEKSIAPYIISGVIRVCLNFLLVQNKKYILVGAVISGAVGYLVLLIQNAAVSKRVSGTKFDMLNIIIKPTVIGVVSYFGSNLAFSTVNDTKNIFINLLIEFSVFTVLFCILCLLLRVVNFKEIFSMLKSKKNALNT